ncbi:MAG: hypothetical protein JSR58_06125 [Verrucomicrobia bacterium]|nr:hypothetical protein [Verrucomicrobiota bacterium]
MVYNGTQSMTTNILATLHKRTQYFSKEAIQLELSLAKPEEKETIKVLVACELKGESSRYSQKWLEAVQAVVTENLAPKKAIDPLDSSWLRSQLSKEVKYRKEEILSDSRFKELTLSDQQIILYKLKGAVHPARLCDLLPPDFDPALVDVIDRMYLPKEPPSNLEGKHLVNFYLSQAESLTSNQKRLYAQQIVNSSAFVTQLMKDEQRSVLTGLHLENYENLKQNLSENHSHLIPLIDSLSGNSQALVPFKPKNSPAIIRKPLNEQDWMQELKFNPHVFSSLQIKSLVGTKDQLITLRDAQAIVKVFPNSTQFLISGFSITTEALEYIQEKAPLFRCQGLAIKNAAASPDGLTPESRELKWINAATHVIYRDLASNPNLPKIDCKDARAIIDNKTPTSIKGYVITNDALALFNQHNINIDLRANLIISGEHSSASTTDWNELIDNCTTISPKKTDFDELSQLPDLDQALEPNKRMAIATSPTLIDLDAAVAIVSNLTDKSPVQLIRYELTALAAKYLRENAPRLQFKDEQIGKKSDPAIARNEQLLALWEKKFRNSEPILSWLLKTLGWKISSSEGEIITLRHAKAFLQILSEHDLKQLPFHLEGFYLTQEAWDLLQGKVKLEECILTKEIDPTAQERHTWSKKFAESIPVYQFKEGITGGFHLIDEAEVQHLIQTREKLNISNQICISGYAITDKAWLMLKQHFPSMELYPEQNRIVTSADEEGNWKYPGFGGLLASHASLDGHLSNITQSQHSIIDDENVEALIAAMQKLFPDQRVALIGYTVTEDVKSRLGQYADLRFAKFIPAAPKIASPSELALVPVNNNRELTFVQKHQMVSVEKKNEKWIHALQSADIVSGSFFATPFTANDKYIDLDDAKRIIEICESETGYVQAIRGHTLTQEAFDHLRTHAPQIDLRLNRIAPSESAIIMAQKIGKVLATILGAVIVVAAIAGVFMLVGEVAFIILAFATLGAFLVLIGKTAQIISTPLLYAVERLPLWLYMLELYTRSLGEPERREEKIGKAAVDALEKTHSKFKSWWASRHTNNQQALIVVQA